MLNGGFHVSTENISAQEQQRLRRARVNRIRRGIVITISSWMLLSFLAIIILTICLVCTNYKLSKMEDYVTLNQSLPSNATVVSTEMEEFDFSKVETGIDFEENMANSTDAHKVYLTCDCVPSDNTLELLAELRKYNIKATFFISAEAGTSQGDILQEIVADGHTSAMKSYSNQMSQVYASRMDFLNDYQEIHSYILSSTGVNCNYYRFPGGSGNEISNLNMAEFAQILKEHGVTYYDWNVSAGDASSDYTSEQVVENVMNGVSQYKTSIVLLHDEATKSNTVAAIGPLRAALQEMGAEVLPIDDDTILIQYIHEDSIE